MAKHDAGYYAAQFLNPIGPVGLIYEGVSEGIASGREASAAADMSKANAAAARARATEQQAKADQAAAAARQQLAAAAKAERQASGTGSAAGAAAGAAAKARPTVAGSTLSISPGVSSAGTSMQTAYIVGILLVVAGGAYYVYSKGKR
jgi:uncharacterized membrane protein